MGLSSAPAHLVQHPIISVEIPLSYHYWAIVEQVVAAAAKYFPSWLLIAIVDGKKL